MQGKCHTGEGYGDVVVSGKGGAGMGVCASSMLCIGRDCFINLMKSLWVNYCIPEHTSIRTVVIWSPPSLFLHRSDLLYRAVHWVWEVWQLYNHCMLRLDLPELAVGKQPSYI